MDQYQRSFRRSEFPKSTNQQAFHDLCCEKWLVNIHQSPEEAFSTFIQQNFWSKIFWSSTKSVSSSFDNLSKTKISKLQVAVLMDKKILRLEIPKRVELFAGVL